MKPSIIAAVSAVSLAAAAISKSKPRETQESSEPRANKIALELMDLNEASKEELMELDGLDAGAAERVIRMRPYRDHADAVRKLGTFYRLQPSAMKAAA